MKLYGVDSKLRRSLELERKRERSPSLVTRHRGVPCVGGTRIPVDLVIGGFRAGVSFRALHRVWPEIPVEVFEAVVRWDLTGRGRVKRKGAKRRA